MKKYRKRKKKDGAFSEGGRWYYDFSIKKTRYRGALPECANQAQAVRATSTIRQQIYDGTWSDGNKTKLTDFIADVYEPSAKLKRSFYTFHEAGLKPIKEYFKDHAVEEITPFLVEKFKRELFASPVKGKPNRAPATVNCILSVLSSVLTMAVKGKLIAENPCSDVERLREDNVRIRALSVEEESGLFAAIGERFERFRPVIVLALETGMRLSEIINLCWQQVDWERNRIVVVNTKTAKDRFIPMSQTVRRLLLELRLEKNPTRIFPNLTRMAVSQAFRRLVAEAKVEDFHFHDLRHTFATRLVESGADSYSVKALLGHSSVTMTERYAHPSAEHQAAAIEKLANFNEICRKNVRRANLQIVK